MRNATALASLLIVLGLPSFGQAPSSRADEAYTQQNWSAAAELYRAETQRDSQNGRAWLRLGQSLRKIGRPGDAVAALEHAQQLNFAKGMTNVLLLGAYAESKEHERAVAHLEQMQKTGFIAYKLIEQDAAWEQITADSKLKSIIDTMRIAAEPCRDTQRHPEYRQFDFWVGEWNVFSPAGLQVGKSRIEKIVGDCIILENWTSGAGSDGKSFNKWNPQLERWEQFWASEGGETTFFFGHLEGKNLVYKTDAFPQPDGTKQERRLTFFNLGPNEVRQFSEISSDGGKTYTTEYDFTYKRVQ
jgi:tetratricopeptide (TPR) repeat protein